MKEFGGSIVCLDRDDINTDEIIPAKYLTENSKEALKPYILEDLKLVGFDPDSGKLQKSGVIVTRGNFGCGSSREHAVWVFEVNNINVVIAESFARIFRQNMFNCGMLAVELKKEEIEQIIAAGDGAIIKVDLKGSKIILKGDQEKSFPFELNSFDQDLVEAGGWLAYADRNY